VFDGCIPARQPVRAVRVRTSQQGQDELGQSEFGHIQARTYRHIRQIGTFDYDHPQGGVFQPHPRPAAAGATIGNADHASTNWGGDIHRPDLGLVPV
jgi:hypothetical protein